MLRSDVILGADGGALHKIESEDELHGPWPAAFTAATLNSYSWFSIKLMTFVDRSGIRAWDAFVHLSSDMRRFST